MNKLDDFVKIGIDLSRKIKKEILDFWKLHPESTIEDQFNITSICMGNVIAQIAFHLFKKNTSEIKSSIETMIFPSNSSIEIYFERYSTWQEAEKGHEKAVKWVMDGCSND